MKITRVRTWTVRVPLEEPLRLGGMVIPEREYVFVRVETRDGRFGAAWSLTRGLPVGEVTHRIASLLMVGQDVENTTRIWQEVYRSNGPAAQGGITMRALSLLDIAIWDLKAQIAGMPLHQLLGGLKSKIPVIAVSGYPGTSRGPEEFGERLSELAAAGHALVKAARWPDPADTRRLLDRAEVPGIVVDAAWAWEDAQSALAELELWGDRPLAWLEDPLPIRSLRAYRKLKEGSRHPLGVGDEISDPATLADLALDGTTDFLRIDAAISGGITAARRTLDICWHAGIPASMHVGLPIHLHLAASSPACIGVESFVGEDADLDPIDGLLVNPPVITDGNVHVTSEEGMACFPDWPRIARMAHLHTDTDTNCSATHMKENK